MNKIQNEGQWVDISAQLNSNFEQIETDIIALQQTSWANKGYYYNEEDLLSTHPTSNVGDRAFVGSFYPYVIYLYTADGWIDTGETGDAAELQLKSHVDKHEQQLVNLETQLRIESDGSSETIADIHSQLSTVIDGINAHTTQISSLNETKADKAYTDELVSQAEKEAKDYTDEKAKQNAAAVNLLSEELDRKAPKVGYAPDLKVDFAKELVGRGVAEPQEIGVIRPTGEISIGDGNATIEKVKGKSVVWNQLYKEGCESLGVVNNYKPFTEKVVNGVTFTAQSDGSIKANGTASGNAWLNLVTTNKSGHKFMMQGCPQGGSSDTYGIADGAVGRHFADVGGGVIYTAATKKSNLDLFVVNGTTVVDIVFKPQYINLTQMFGAGNEPTTIEEFEARKPLGVTDEYNEGEIISYNAKELKSVGFNAWDEEWEDGDIDPNGENISSTSVIRSKNYTPLIPNQTYRAEYPNSSNTYMGLKLYDNNKNWIANSTIGGGNGQNFNSGNDYAYARFTFPKASYSTICIHLAHTGYRNGEYVPYEEDTLQLPNIKDIKDNDGNQLFPYGLLSAGNAHDEITATKAIKRIGVVDLGGKVTTMIVQREGKFLYMASIPNIAQGVFAIKMQAIVNSTKYTVGAQQDWPTYMNIISSYNSSSNRVLVSSEIEGVASINEDLQGVLLYYELAEPIEVDLEEPLNLTYDAWDFGTEEIIAEGTTTPLNADIVYQFNAVDRIRENTAKNQALEAELAELKAQLTQLTQASK